MEKKTVTGVLNNYFNVGEGKRPASVFLAELKALTDAEKRELAELAAPLLGVALI